MACILVTGSRGTLGTSLVRELKHRGHDVWQLDLQHQADLQYFRADISNHRQLARVFEISPEITFTTFLNGGEIAEVRGRQTRRVTGMSKFVFRSAAKGYGHVLLLAFYHRLFKRLR